MKKRSGFSVMCGLIGMVKPLSGYMIIAIIMGLLGHLSAIFITVFGAFAILNVLGIKMILSLKMIFISVILFAVVRGFLRYAEQSCNHFIAFKLLAIIRDKVFIALRRLCPAKLEGRDKGDLISVITSDIELLEVFYAHTISPVVIAILNSIVMCIFIGRVHLILALMALMAYVIVGLFIPVIISGKSKDTGNSFRDKTGELSSFVLDSLRGLPEILQYNRGIPRLSEMNDRTEKLSEYEKHLKMLNGFNLAITNTVILLCNLCMIIVSVLLYNNGSIDFAGVLVSVVALMSSYGPVVALANLGSGLQNTFAAGNRVLDILEESPLTADIVGKQDIEFKGIKASNVTFSYENAEGNEEILSNITVDIPQEKIVGISGKSGSGKSTLLKLFMRFWTTNEGSIDISNVSIDNINTENLRNMESFVTQDTYLFNDSIKNNIRIAKLDATDEEIETACKKASIHNFIMKLPNGYDTKTGELGEMLSGGEKQRIGLARAFLHNAPLMLLDEPTSNLDSLNEAIILKSLKEEGRGKTVALVSHRQSTMRITDKVYSIENGRLS
ncbi:MAG: ABC transporter ATP-binding protein [Clostridiales bacterium]|nr:ABC transporter ATP-binding protein [Clostridiales bacterium]